MDLTQQALQTNGKFFKFQIFFFFELTVFKVANSSVVFMQAMWGWHLC